MKDKMVSLPLNESSSASCPSSPPKCNLNEMETNGLNKLRQMVQESGKLKDQNIPDEMLLKFLRSRDCNVKIAAALIKSYINFIITKPDLFTWSDEVIQCIRTLVYYPYQHRGPNGEVIVGMELGKWDPSKIKFESIIQTSLFLQESFLQDESVQTAGFTFLVDMRNVSLRHIYQMGVNNAMLLATLTDHCMPIITKNIHVCYENRLTNFAYSMFRPFLSEELKRRVIFHGSDMTNLFKFLPSQYLSSNWKGTNEEPQLDDMIDQIKAKSHQIVKTWETYRK
ncbi:retinaldehyde-binding protein 1 [Tetranychus urticae]|uniref:retinaldehyde-binding protein 1 n=1 Tax=Tetranychus urticae TaxID=32264 RepID=UPI00077BA771|nr:retinaldehyde-binding protein 1 [Tetranychus urticae]